MADAKKITMLSELPILPDVANFETVGLALTISCSHGKPQISLPCFFQGSQDELQSFDPKRCVLRLMKQIHNRTF